MEPAALEVAAFVVHHARFHIQHGAPARAGLSQLVVEADMVARGAISVWSYGLHRPVG
jgi:hypothetical protein